MYANDIQTYECTGVAGYSMRCDKIYECFAPISNADPRVTREVGSAGRGAGSGDM